MTRKTVLRSALAASAASVLFVGGPAALAAAAPGQGPGNDNGHHHCGGNSGQGQGNQCPDPGDNGGQTPPDNGGGDQGGGDTDPGDNQNPPDNGGSPGDNTDPGDNQTPPDNGGDPGDNGGQTPPDNGGGDQGGGDHGGGDHHGPKPGGDGHGSQPPKGDTTIINVGIGIDLSVVIAPNITVHFGDTTVNNITINQVTNVTTTNIVVNGGQYNEVTVYSAETGVYYLGYYDEVGDFHCTGYYSDDVETPEQANAALVSNNVVRQVPDVEVVTGVNPTGDGQDNLKWAVPAAIAAFAAAGYGVVTVVRRRHGGDNGPTSIPGA